MRGLEVLVANLCVLLEHMAVASIMVIEGVAQMIAEARR